jgi:2-oxoisovalerate dehydrogenase E1 component
LLKGAFYDPNPVVLLEHKGLYWSKVPGTQEAKTFEPDEDYVIPLGKANTVLSAVPARIDAGETMVIITYGMGVYWAKDAASNFEGRIEILDLRTLNPLDWSAITTSVQRHGRALVLTEEPLLNSFAESLAGRISKECFQYLDAPVWTLGAADLPAVPLNVGLERMMLPNPSKVRDAITAVLEY